MKQAVIITGGKQYLVAEEQELDIELTPEAKELSFVPLLVFDEKKASVGAPEVKGGKVTASVLEPEVKGEKLKIMKFKPKKRVRRLTGHRQKHTRIKITGIS